MPAAGFDATSQRRWKESKFFKLWRERIARTGTKQLIGNAESRKGG
jgi:hypothetical protein